MDANSIATLVAAITGLVTAIAALVTAFKARGKANDAHDIGTEASVKADQNGAKIEDIKAQVNGGMPQP
jgi:hypothetical protein